MSQLSLFPDPQTPNRIELFPDFLSVTEESALLKDFESVSWQEIKMHGVTAKRRVAHYGLDYTYTKRSVQETRPAPSWLDSLTVRVAPLIYAKPEDVREVLITYYPAGAGIGWHRDAEVFGDAIVGVSLLSDCTMKFKNETTSEVFKLEIPRRSAYVFAHEARWDWLHTISNHSEDRYSITFRTLLDRFKAR